MQANRNATPRYVNNTDRTPIGVKFIPLYQWQVLALNREQLAAFDQLDFIASIAHKSPNKDSLNRDIPLPLPEQAENNISEYKKQLRDIRIYLGDKYHYAIALCQSTIEGDISSDCVKDCQYIARQLVKYFS